MFSAPLVVIVLLSTSICCFATVKDVRVASEPPEIISRDAVVYAFVVRQFDPVRTKSWALMKESHGYILLSVGGRLDIAEDLDDPYFLTEYYYRTDSIGQQAIIEAHLNPRSIHGMDLLEDGVRLHAFDYAEEISFSEIGASEDNTFWADLKNKWLQWTRVHGPFFVPSAVYRLDED